MAALSFENQNASTTQPRLDWGAIWAGMFTFAGIWAVFGFLGIAVFSSTGNVNAAHLTTEMGVGMGIWAIVLTIIAMYVAGLETGRLAAASNRLNGLLHGMVMFGLSLVGIMVLIIIGNGITVAAAPVPAVHGSSLFDMNVGLSWAGFLSLFLGWLAAMSGASVGARRKTESNKPAQPLRNAA